MALSVLANVHSYVQITSYINGVAYRATFLPPSLTSIRSKSKKCRVKVSSLFCTSCSLSSSFALVQSLCSGGIKARIFCSAKYS